MVLLVTSDGETFTADKEIVQRSMLVKNMLEDFGKSGQPIPLPNVSSTILRKILEYCEHHSGEILPSEDANKSQDHDISEWDNKFITVDQDMLPEITRAAKYLEIKSLVDVCNNVPRKNVV